MGRGCEKGEARSRREEEVDAVSSSTTSNAEIFRNPYSPFGLQAASACNAIRTLTQTGS